MDKCPSCDQWSFSYDPATSAAQCLRIRCGYNIRMPREDYFREVEREDLDVARKLYFEYLPQVAPAK